MFGIRRPIQPGDVFYKSDPARKYVAFSEPFHDLDLAEDGDPNDRLMVVWAARVWDDWGNLLYYDGAHPPELEQVSVRSGTIDDPERLANYLSIRNAILIVFIYRIIEWFRS